MPNKKMVLLMGPKESTNIIYNALKHEFPIEKVIVEKPVSKYAIFKNRVKKLGLNEALGQAAFCLFIVPWLRMVSFRRISELKIFFNLDDSLIDKEKIILVSSVNSDQVVDLLKKINPAIVIISGTRIIKERILRCVSSSFINMHAGITPLYRGVHGAYWALVDNNREKCGVTIHFVDNGVDTGDIIEQGIIHPTREDNVATYSFLQLGVGLTLLKKAVNDILRNSVKIKSHPKGASSIFSHPTLWGYIWRRLYHGVR